MIRSDLVTDIHPYGNRQTIYLNYKENRKKAYVRKTIGFYAAPVYCSL